MCLEVSRLAIKRVALKDITVYKCISSYVNDNGDKIYITPYRKSEIKLYTEYTSEFNKTGNQIEEALHSLGDIRGCFDLCIDRYLYLWGYTKSFALTHHIVECVIPKGSRYYKGKFDGKVSYASNKLIYKKILSLN